MSIFEKRETERKKEEIWRFGKTIFFLGSRHNSFAVHTPDVPPRCGKPSNAFCPKCIPVFSLSLPVSHRSHNVTTVVRDSGTTSRSH